MSTEPVVAKDVAEAEFQRFAEAMDLDLDQSRMTADDISSFAEQKHKIIRAMMRNHLVVNQAGEMVYTPQLGDNAPITFYEPTGASLMAMDKVKRGEDTAKTYAFMADMTQTSVQRFSKMKSRDFRVCQAIALLFLG